MYCYKGTEIYYNTANEMIKENPNLEEIFNKMYENHKFIY